MSAKVTVTHGPVASPEELARLRALAPPPPATMGTAALVMTPGERLRRALREFDDAKSHLVDEAELLAAVDRFTRETNDATKEAEEFERMAKELRQKAATALASLQGARGRRADDRVAAEARARFERAEVELNGAREAVAEEEAQKAAAAAVAEHTSNANTDPASSSGPNKTEGDPRP